MVNGGSNNSSKRTMKRRKEISATRDQEEYSVGPKLNRKHGCKALTREGEWENL